jgi:hypothetical protein
MRDHLRGVSSGLAGLLLAVVVLFTAMGVYSSLGFRDDVNEATSSGDDWLMYKGMALNILDEGWTIPAARWNYFRPGGFLYNYFIAAVFALTGRNVAYVYLVQAVLLGISVAVLTIAFRPFLLVPTQYLFALMVAGSAYLDVYRNYTFKLLSENLLVFLLPFFWLTVTNVIRHRERAAALLLCGFVFGLCALTRPNLMPFMPVIALVMWWRLSLRIRQVAAMFVGFAVCVSMMVVRNYEVTGQLSLAVVTGSGDWMRPPEKTLTSAVVFYGRRILFSLGFLPMLMEVYHVRPHWVLAWCGVVARAGRRQFETWEVLVIVFIVIYLGPLVAVGIIESYGYRMIAPVIPFVMLLAVRVLDLKLRERTRATPLVPSSL